MQQAFEETPNAEMLQADFWNLYKKASVDHGIDSTLTATKLLKLVTTTFPQAYLKVVPGTSGEPSKYMIIGLGCRRKVAKNPANDPPAQPIEEPQPFVKAFSLILKRVLDFSMTVQYLNACLLPLIRACIAELRSLNVPWPSQPLANFACSVIYNMVKQVGPKPLVPLTNAELMSLGCGCTHCLDLRRFAASDVRVLAVRAGEKVRRHVEGQLGMKAREWGFTCVTIRVGSPHTLQVRTLPLITICSKLSSMPTDHETCNFWRSQDLDRRKTAGIGRDGHSWAYVHAGGDTRCQMARSLHYSAD
jgi:hypothetical protein